MVISAGMRIVEISSESCKQCVRRKKGRDIDEEREGEEIQTVSMGASGFFLKNPKNPPPPLDCWLEEGGGRDSVFVSLGSSVMV